MDATDQAMIDDIAATKGKVERLLEQYKFREALFEVIDLSRKGNRYLQVKEPWKKAAPGGGKNDASAGAKVVELPGAVSEENQQLIDNCLHICLQLTANLAILINPFLPFTAKRMLHMMKVVEKMLDWENAGKMNLLSVGYSLRPQEYLFRQIENDEIKAQVEKLQAASAAKQAETAAAAAAPAPVPPPPAEEKPTIVYDDFAKLDLRVGTIVTAEKVEKADKLLKLGVDLGTEIRTIVSGIALHFKPEDIVGRQVVVVANLAPRKMRGIESNGMILMAEDKAGRLHFVNPADPIEPGSGVS